MCALAFEGQGPCAAGWCINPPLQVPGGQALAELRVDADPMLQSIDGLSTGLIQIVGQPGDFVNLGTLDAAIPHLLVLAIPSGKANEPQRWFRGGA